MPRFRVVQKHCWSLPRWLQHILFVHEPWQPLRVLWPAFSLLVFDFVGSLCMFPTARNRNKRLSVQNFDVTIPSSSAFFVSFLVSAKTLFMPSNAEWYSSAEWYSDTRPRWTEWGLLFYLNLSFYYPCSKSARACNITSVSNFIWTLHFILIGWFSNRTGTSVDNGKARGKD